MSVFRRAFRSWILWLGLFLIIVLGAAVYLILTRGVQSAVTKQILTVEQTIAAAEASNINSFFETFGDSMVVLSQLNSVEQRDKNVLADLDTFVKQRQDNGLISGVILTDKSGVVQFNSNVLGTRDIGKSIADRDFFAWAKDKSSEGKYYISKPLISRLGASIGQTVIVVASPVFQNGVFTGVVAASVRLQPVAERFLGLMKVSDLAEVDLVDEQGNVLYSHTSQSARQTIGSNISGLFSGSITNVLNATQEGELQSETHLIAYSPVVLGTQKWLLFVSVPVQVAVDAATPFYIKQAAVWMLASFTVILFGAIVFKKR